MPLSERTRGLAWAFAAACVATMGGTVYGWPAMRKILLRDGTLDTCNNATAVDAGEPCEAQELAFGVISTVGFAFNRAAECSSASPSTASAPGLLI